MAKKKKGRIQLDQSEGFGGTLGAKFGEMLGVTSTSMTESFAQEKPQQASEPAKSQPAKRKIEMRVTRKGYGGKTVTECRGLNATDDAAVTALSRSLAKALGVRVFWKGDTCCVQGDQVERLIPYFESHGHDIQYYAR